MNSAFRVPGYRLAQARAPAVAQGLAQARAPGAGATHARAPAEEGTNIEVENLTKLEDREDQGHLSVSTKALVKHLAEATQGDDEEEVNLMQNPAEEDDDEESNNDDYEAEVQRARAAWNISGWVSWFPRSCASIASIRCGETEPAYWAGTIDNRRL